MVKRTVRIRSLARIWGKRSTEEAEWSREGIGGRRQDGKSEKALLLGEMGLWDRHKDVNGKWRAAIKFQSCLPRERMATYWTKKRAE